MGVVALGAWATPGVALPPSSAPRNAPSTPATVAPVGPTLPFGSTIYFVLDDGANSGKTTPGTVVRMHLRDALAVNGTVIAPAGTPATMEIVSARKSQMGDVDGALQVFLRPLALPGRDVELPIRALHEYLTVELTSGARSTRSATDQVVDVFVPYGLLYPIFRKGRQMVLTPGSVLRAETAATVDATVPGRISIATPPPFVHSDDQPHADLTPAPFYTPAPARPHPSRNGKPTLPPSPPASASPGASTSPSASVSPPVSAAPDSAGPASPAPTPTST